jgi:Probable N6-adenine methyltransferase
MEEIPRNTALKVIIEDVSSHPHCPHGPTILFDRNGEQFFACSCCRDKKDCHFHMRATDWPSRYTLEKSKQPKTIVPTKNSITAFKFCESCQCLVIQQDDGRHKGHNLQPLPPQAIKFPASFLPPLSNDKREAQYFFSMPTLLTFEQIFRKANINKVVCMGAPRLHEFLKNHCGIKSVLLDIDQRFRWFYDEKTYFHYNMFNDHFFDGEGSRAAFEEFLKEDE